MVDMPKTQAEKEFEIYILSKAIVMLKHGVAIEELLNAIERVRHVITEIKLDTD
jgi:hypothetical protein